jgi:hypothetical protein
VADGAAVIQIRTTHRYGFRCGEWAQLVRAVADPESMREIYMVRFADGVIDFWVATDRDGGYEYRTVP